MFFISHLLTWEPGVLNWRNCELLRSKRCRGLRWQLTVS